MITYCQKLVSIAKFYGFDGWFINIESPIPQGTIPPTRFATFLSTLTKMVHNELPGEPLVIWYDSLTVHGNVSWQNGLTQQNSIFFNSCDGIFLNYCWNIQKLHDSIKICQKLARDPCDIFVGVDVFGRNCYGGFDTYKSLDLIDMSHHNLSIGIFAPGWTFEKALEINAKKSPRQQQILYEQNENLLWLGNFKTHGIGNYRKKPPSVLMVYENVFGSKQDYYNGFLTTFNTGYGLSLFKNGKKVREGPWIHLFKQDISYDYHPIGNNLLKYNIVLNYDVAYNGGSSLDIGMTGGDTSISLLKLCLNLEKNANDGKSQWEFSLTYSLPSLVDSLSLQFMLADKDGLDVYGKSLRLNGQKIIDRDSDAAGCWSTLSVPLDFSYCCVGGLHLLRINLVCSGSLEIAHILLGQMQLCHVKS